MLHPKARLYNSRIEGKGLIATGFLPKGTIIWRHSDKDKVRIYTWDQYKSFSPAYRKTIDRFSYPDESGNLVLSLDDDKHWNHSCDANVLDLPTAQMCIAVRDIQPSEEITYDYALNLRPDLSFKCNCGAAGCRNVIRRAQKSSKLYAHLLCEEKDAAKMLDKVPQPLLK